MLKVSPRAFVVLFALGLFSGPALAAETITYTYDAQGRLVAVESAGTVNDGEKAVISYDDANNRTNYCVGANCSLPTQPQEIQITDTSLNVLSAHQSVYTCQIINIPEYGIYYEYCTLNLNGYTVYDWPGSGSRNFDPGYSMTVTTRLDVDSSYYGTGVSP